MAEANAMIVIATCALVGWWLTLRPNASYRGAGGTTSALIVLMAVLMFTLAMGGQAQPPVAPSAYAMVSPHACLPQ